MRLLSEAGLINAQIQETSDGTGHIGIAIAKYVTQEGHDLLFIMRSEKVWNKIKETAKSEGVEMTLALVLSRGNKFMEDRFS